VHLHFVIVHFSMDDCHSGFIKKKKFNLSLSEVMVVKCWIDSNNVFQGCYPM